MQHSASGSTNKLRIGIVGGGIAGLVAALAFEQQRAQLQGTCDLEVLVFEQAHKFAEIGAGVSLGLNAQQVLRAIGLQAELEAVAGTTGNGLKDPNLWFQYRVGQTGDNEGQVFAHIRGENAGRGNVHRADFLDQLIQKLPPGVARFNHRVLGYSTTETGVQLEFEDKKLDAVEVDVLIASDGIKSRVRAELYARRSLDMQLQQARYAEWIAWRGLIPREKYNAVFPEDAEALLNRMHVGQGKHILTFPVRGGTLVNLVGFVRDKEHAKLGGHTGPWSEARPQQELLEDFADFSEQLKDLLRAIDNPSIWGIFCLDQLTEVVDDRVLLIGDAAHATTPHCGAGAGQAIEDAFFAARLLTHRSILSRTGPARSEAINRALQVYQRERHPRGARVQQWSYKGGLLYEFLGPEGDDLHKMREALEGRMSWIWDYDAEADVARVERLLDEQN